MPLSTVASVKEYLGVSGTSEDALISRLIDQATDFIHSYCGRIFPQASYDEYYDGDGTEGLLASQYPIQSVTLLSVGGLSRDPSSYVVYGQLGLIRLKNGAFPRGKKNIRLQYTAGYLTIPRDIEQACVELVALKYYDRGRERLGVGERSGTTFLTQLPQEIKLVLDLYKRYGL